MKRTITALCLVLALCLGAAPAQAAWTSEGGGRAEALDSLGLLTGTGSGYGLDRTATRAEGLVMLLRLTGDAEAAEAHPADHGFSDVPAWAGGYVAYGVEKGLTSGVGGGRFGSDNVITANQYASFILRALGYGDGDFNWESATRKLYDLNIVTAAQLSRWTGGTFRRSDLADLSYDALRAETKGGGTLAERLAAKGLFTEAAARAAGVWPGTEPLPVSQESDPLRPGMGNTPANLAFPARVASGFAVIGNMDNAGGMGAYDDENVYFIDQTSIYRTPLLGGRAEKLTTAAGTAGEPWNEWLGGLNVYDGSLYYYAKVDGAGKSGVWRYDLNGGSCTQLAQAKPFSTFHGLTVSDGSLYLIIENAPTGLKPAPDNELWRMELDGSGETLVQSWPVLDLHDLAAEDFIPGANLGILSDGYLYRQAPGTPVSSPIWGRNIQTESLVRAPISGGALSTLAESRSDPPGGGEGAAFWQHYSPIPDGGWVYYLENLQTTASQKRLHMDYGVSGVWRMRTDGSGKELLYENQTPDTKLPHSDPNTWEISATSMTEAYNVCDGAVILNRPGTTSLNAETDSTILPPTIMKVENGKLTGLYAGPTPTSTQESQFGNLFTAPGWIFFARDDQTYHDLGGGMGKITHVQAVYRMRPDGSGLERLTPEISY